MFWISVLIHVKSYIYMNFFFIWTLFPFYFPFLTFFFSITKQNTTGVINVVKMQEQKAFAADAVAAATAAETRHKQQQQHHQHHSHEQQRLRQRQRHFEGGALGLPVILPMSPQRTRPSSSPERGKRKTLAGDNGGDGGGGGDMSAATSGYRRHTYDTSSSLQSLRGGTTANRIHLGPNMSFADTSSLSKEDRFR